jgi:hypothetical protein
MAHRPVVCPCLGRGIQFSWNRAGGDSGTVISVVTKNPCLPDLPRYASHHRLTSDTLGAITTGAFRFHENAGYPSSSDANVQLLRRVADDPSVCETPTFATSTWVLRLLAYGFRAANGGKSGLWLPMPNHGIEPHLFLPSLCQRAGVEPALLGALSRDLMQCFVNGAVTAH